LAIQLREEVVAPVDRRMKVALVVDVRIGAKPPRRRRAAPVAGRIRNASRPQDKPPQARDRLVGGLDAWLEEDVLLGGRIRAVGDPGIEWPQVREEDEPALEVEEVRVREAVDLRSDPTDSDPAPLSRNRSIPRICR
jgi:hypothetical protein